MTTEEKTNGAPQIPEGELMLLVRVIPKTNEFQCIFPDLFTALALHDLAGEYLAGLKRKMFAVPQIQQPPLPPITAGMLKHFGKGRS